MRSFNSFAERETIISDMNQDDERDDELDKIIAETLALQQENVHISGRALLRAKETEDIARENLLKLYGQGGYLVHEIIIYS